MTNAISLYNLPHLAELFRLFNGGRHLNRLAEPTLWAELEQRQQDYMALFAGLGYQLMVDGRGFAWFQNEDLSATVSNQSRQLALLFMVIFDTQADAGLALNRFHEWRIERSLLEAAFEQHQELLTAEELNVDTLLSLLDKAETFGFTRRQGNHWQLLPAVCRYLDHFEALAEQERTRHQELEQDAPTPGPHSDEKEQA